MSIVSHPAGNIVLHGAQAPTSEAYARRDLPPCRCADGRCLRELWPVLLTELGEGT